MEFEEIKEIILSLEDTISERMRKYIHYKSMRNFVNHFYEIQNDRARYRIAELLSEYIEEIKAVGYDFDVYSSTDLAKKYLFNIEKSYPKNQGFLGKIKTTEVFF